MANRLLVTPRTDHPRIHCNAADKVMLQARSNASTSWKTEWEAKCVPYCNNQLSKPDADLAAESPLDQKFQTLGLVGWIDGIQSILAKLKSAGLVLASSHSVNDDPPGLWVDFTSRQDQIIGLAHGYDFLMAGKAASVVSFSDADRKTWGEGLIDMCTAGWSVNEYIDGHSGGNQMCQLIAGLVLHGEIGSGFNFTSAANTLINNALEFWYGVTPSGTSRMETERYYGQNGGAKGGQVWYQSLGCSYSARVLDALAHGCSSMTLDGAAYSPYVHETWFGKHPEWWIRMWSRGSDKDFMIGGDTPRISNPFFTIEARILFPLLIKNGLASLRKPMRWLRDRVMAVQEASGSPTANYLYAQEVVTWDPADAANVSQSPTQAGMTKWKLFDPDGTFVYDSDPAQGTPNTKIAIQVPELDTPGHTDLRSGAEQIESAGDMVLTRSGRYKATNGLSEDLGGQHNRAWYQQSISHSSVPLVHDSSHDSGSFAHTNFSASGSRIAYPTGLGGSVWKRRDLGGGTYEWDPGNVTDMVADGSGMAWRRAGIDAAGTNRLRVVSYLDTKWIHLAADYRRAYLLEETMFGGSNERVRLMESQWVIIEEAWVRPIIFRVDRVKSRLSTFKKRVAFHSHGPWAKTTPAMPENTLRLSSPGFRNLGKIVIDFYTGYQALTHQLFPTSWPNDLSNISGASSSFSYGGTDYRPTNAPIDREKPDFGREMVQVMPLVDEVENWLVSVKFPMAVGDVPPNYEWDENATHFIFRLGSFEYRLGKTTVSLETGADTTPPAVPTMRSAVPTGVSGQVRVVCDPNTDDTATYKFQYRIPAGAWSTAGTVAQTNPITAPVTFFVEGLTPNQVYEFAVSALDGAVPPNESARSSALTTTALGTSIVHTPMKRFFG